MLSTTDISVNNITEYINPKKKHIYFNRETISKLKNRPNSARPTRIKPKQLKNDWLDQRYELYIVVSESSYDEFSCETIRFLNYSAVSHLYGKIIKIKKKSFLTTKSTVLRTFMMMSWKKLDNVPVLRPSSRLILSRILNWFGTLESKRKWFRNEISVRKWHCRELLSLSFYQHTSNKNNFRNFTTAYILYLISCLRNKPSKRINGLDGRVHEKWWL